MKQATVALIFGLALSLSADAKEWYETAAFYQIYPQSFFDGGGGGKPGTGTLKGIEAKLDYIEDLGIDCLWLTPIFESSFQAYGYDITDYKKIDPRYGSAEDFSQLVTAVHARGMKIIVDFVPNHCGAEHEFFKKSVAKEGGFDDWFVWTNVIGNAELKKPSNWQRIGGGPGTAWTKIDGRDDFFYAQFSPNMPDLNLRNKKVLEYLEEVMKFWLDAGVDGFRIDAISHGIEALPDADGTYADEERNPEVSDENPEDFDFLNHTLTQDQTELFDIVYDWRKFLNDYQTNKKGEAR